MSGGISRAARDLAEFHRHIGQVGPGRPCLDQHEGRVELRKRLLGDELAELFEALDAADLVGIAHETADLVYAAYGLAETYGFDLDAVLAEVHRSNMSKDAGPTGKAVKGSRFRPADVAGVLARQKWRELCTGVAAQWCPNHGTCTCPKERPALDGELQRTLDSANCPLHSEASSHATDRPRCRRPECPDFGDVDFGEATCPADHADLPEPSEAGRSGSPGVVAGLRNFGGLHDPASLSTAADG